MKGSDYLKWIRRLVILGAVVAAVTASTAGAVRPADDPVNATQNLPTIVTQPPDVRDVALRVATAQTPERFASANPYDGYKSSYTQLHQLGVAAQVPDVDLKSSYPQLHAAAAAAIPVSRPPDVRDVAAQIGVTAPPDAFERYATAHPYGIGTSTSTAAIRPPDVSDAAALVAQGGSSPTVVLRPPDVSDAAALVAQGGGSTIQVNGFDWTDWAIGIGTGLGLVLLLGVGFVMSRQMRQHPQPA